MYGVNASVPKTLDPSHRRLRSCRLRRPRCSAHWKIFWQRRSVRSFCLPTTAKSPRKPKIWWDLMPCTISFCITLYAGRLRLPKSIDWLVMRLAAPMIPTRSKKWLVSFYRRFSPSSLNALACRTDLKSVRSVFPPGDWRMPSDACAKIWLAQAEAL